MRENVGRRGLALDTAVHFQIDEQIAPGVVRMSGCLGQAQHRGKADIAAFELFAPLCLRLPAHDFATQALTSGPVRLCLLAPGVHIGQTQLLQLLQGMNSGSMAPRVMCLPSAHSEHFIEGVKC